MIISDKYRAVGRALGAVIASSVIASALHASSVVDLPSGVEAELHEVLVDSVGGEAWVRFRLVAPEINREYANAPGFFDLEADFPHICDKLAVPYLSEFKLASDVIVISLMDRVVDFGTSNADATQFFEQFRLVNGACVWEEF